MPLDRHSIEKRDFPIGPNGYDPDAVDAHLAQIASEVEELRAASGGRGETLATSASEQVRGILEAAENSAAEIRRQATAQARDYLSRVAESAQSIRRRLHAMESELSALLEWDTQASVASAPSAEPPAEPEPEAVDPGPAAPPPEPEPEEADLAGGFRATGSAGAAGLPLTGDDTEGARLIALNMALNGTSREDTDRYLSENFSLRDRASLLDEVYSSVES